MALTIVPTFQWVYQDDTPADTKFEKFGPRADRLLIKLYSGQVPLFEALTTGEIDIANLELSEATYNELVNPPLNETMNIISCGTGNWFYMLDINNNGNEYLGNPPDPAYPNPVYPNPCSVTSFRQAIAHLVDRNLFNKFLIPIYAPLPPSVWSNQPPNPYPYNRTKAEDLLDADGFPVNPATGWRYWDRNGNGVEDPNERLELKFFIRSDDSLRRDFGTVLVSELNAVGIRVNAIYGTFSAAWYQVFNDKDFHLYTGIYYADSLEFLQTFISNYYWHPGFCPNFNGINDPTYDYYAYGVSFANTWEEAKQYASLAIEIFLNKSFKVPLWGRLLSKAMYRRYTGGNDGTPVTPDDGENKYRGQYWQGVVNISGQCIDNFFTFLNMHPTNYEYGDCENMTIRYGLPITNIMSFNPLYAEWSNSWLVLNLIYDKLIRRNPYNPYDWMPWMVKNYSIGTYDHPIYGLCSKIHFTLRTDIYWNDGTPLTIADIEYTFVEMKHDLEARGLPPPWWIRSIETILSFSTLDPYNFEVLFDVKSIWTLTWIAEVPILPKHVWKPIICGPDGIPGTPDDPPPEFVLGFAPDPDLVGSGPWRLVEYVEFSHVLLAANKRSYTIQTNLPGSQPIHSPFGYFRYYPLNENIHITSPGYEYSHKLPPNFTAEFSITMKDMIREHEIFENVSSVNLGNPIGSFWHKTWPTSSPSLECSSWMDDGDGQLSPDDIILLTPIVQPDTILYWYYIEDMWLDTTTDPPTWHIQAIRTIIAEKTLTIDDLATSTETVHLKPYTPHEQSYIGGFKAGLHFMKLSGHMLEPEPDTWRLRCILVNYTFPFWVTIKEDICGSTLYDDLGYPDYPYKPQLQSPDIKINIFDVAKAASAFGSYPGHPRWNPICDIDGDYMIDIVDIANIAAKFGWEGDP
jgi:ABC-type transport system substrate-binding protein